MSTFKTITRNAGVLFISRFLTYTLAFFYTIYMARYLGATGFGIISFALAFTGILGIFSDLGLSTFMTREIARDKSVVNKYLSNIISIKLILGIFTLVISILLINLLGYPHKTIEVVYLVTLYIICTNFVQMFYSTFQAYEKMEYQSVGEILNSVLMFISIFIAIYYKLDIIAFAFIFFYTSVITLFYGLFISVWKFVLPRINIDLNFWKLIIKEALPFGITGIFITIYISIDSVMLSFMQGNEAVGLYNAAYKIMALLTFIPAIINFAVFPSMSRLHITSQKLLKQIVWKYFKLMIIIGVPIGVGISILSDKIILLIYGSGYEGFIIALQVLIWTMIFVFANASFVQLFQSTDRQITLTKIIGIGALINVILNLILIPRISYVGAGVATVIAELIFSILLIFSTYKIGYGILLKNFVDMLVRVIIASLLMGIVLFYLKSVTTINLFVLIIISSLLYFLILFLIKGIKKEEIKYLRNNFSL